MILPLAQPATPLETPGAGAAGVDRLAVTEQNFRLLVASITDYGIFMLDRDGHVLTWNEGAERLNGYSGAEVVGRHFSLFYTEEDRARRHPEKELDNAERDGRHEEEGWRVRKDGRLFWAHVVITRLRGENGQLVGFAKVTRDLSDRRRAEEEIARTKNLLEQRVQERTEELTAANQQLQDAVRARDDFLSIASHELRTPLTPLKIQVQALERYLRPGAAAIDLSSGRLERMANTISRSIIRIEKLIDSLLDVARINAGRLQLHPEDVDLSQVVREVVGRYQGEVAASGSELRVELPPFLPIHIDRLRFEQILVNLLTNAVKYGEGKPIHLELSRSGNFVQLVVRDEGIGLAPEDLERIFYRFERITNGLGAGGLGLGLFITKQVVEALAGTVCVSGELGRGAEFRVSLPWIPPQSPGV